MSRIKYYFERLFEIDWKNMFRVIGKISKRCHKPYIFILFDTIWCSIKYGAGYMDYFQFFFEKLNSKQRATYINRTVNNKYHRLLNNRDYFHLFQNKLHFKFFIFRFGVCFIHFFIKFTNNSGIICC